MDKILITGANGYIGKHVVKKLLDYGLFVIAADLDTSQVDQRALRININLFKESNSIFDELGHPNKCLHLAWKNGFNHNAKTHITDLPLHYIFLDKLLNAGIKHLSVLGSMHEVGYWEGEVNDKTPTNPYTFYGIAKNSLRQIMQYVAAENKNFVLQWLRAFYIIGDDVNNNSVFSKILLFEKQGIDRIPLTDGNNMYDFITIEDLSNQIAACILDDSVDGIINICSGKPSPLKEQIEKFIKNNNLIIEPAFGEYPSRPYDSPAIWGNSEKINLIMKRQYSKL